MRGIAIGCAGWAIPRQHGELFGDGGSVLARYATRFPVVEVNSSFYRSHQQSTYARWAASVPAQFRFSLKVPKIISHEMALRAAGGALDRFLGEAEGLGDKLGGYLLQLPPSQRLDLRVASTFFRMFRRRSDAPIACEPRHPSWFSSEASALFERHGVSRVIADPPIVAAVPSPRLGSPWPYWRLHGSPRMYYSAYADDTLQHLANDIAACHASALAPWVIFDNTALGFAVSNAAHLQEMLRSPPRSRKGKTHA